MTETDKLCPALASPSYHPRDNVGRALIDAAAQMTRSVDRLARAEGITGAQWVILIRIGGGLGKTASDLCRTLDYNSGAMTRMLDRLGKLGLIARVSCPKDARTVQLSLTPAGEDLYARVRPIATKVLGLHLRGFTPDEITLLMGFLDRIIANSPLSAVGAPPSTSCFAGDLLEQVEP